MKTKHLSIVGANIEGNREKHDFYPTPPHVTKALIRRENIFGRVLEPACGDGRMSEVLKEIPEVDEVVSIDVIDRGYGEHKNYFFYKPKKKFDFIITNPPYRTALKFVRKALSDVKEGGKVCMLMKLVFLESDSRYQFFKENNPQKVYVFSRRLKIYKAGKTGKNSGLIAYAWFVWEKGWKGDTIIKWIGEDVDYNS